MSAGPERVPGPGCRGTLSAHGSHGLGHHRPARTAKSAQQHRGECRDPACRAWGALLGAPNMTESWFPCLTDTGPLHCLPLGSARAPCLVPSLLLALTWCSFRVALRAVIWGLSWCCWVRGAPARAVLTLMAVSLSETSAASAGGRPGNTDRLMSLGLQPPGAGCSEVRSAPTETGFLGPGPAPWSSGSEGGTAVRGHSCLSALGVWCRALHSAPHRPCWEPRSWKTP